MKSILLQINVNESDYKKLAKYGFMFEKNINDCLHEIAQELRQAEQNKKEQKKARKSIAVKID